MADRGSVGPAQVVGGVLAAALIAASAVGGHAGMQVVLREVDDSIGYGDDSHSAPEQVSSVWAAETAAFRMELPHNVTQSTATVTRPNGRELPVTQWIDSSGRADPSVAVFTFDLPAPIADPAQLALAVEAEAVALAEALGDDAHGGNCTVGADVAACYSVTSSAGAVGLVTVVAHGVTILDVVTMATDQDRLSAHDEALATLQWFT